MLHPAHAHDQELPTFHEQQEDPAFRSPPSICGIGEKLAVDQKGAHVTGARHKSHALHKKVRLGELHALRDE